MITKELAPQRPVNGVAEGHSQRFSVEVFSIGDAGDAFCPVKAVVCTEMVSQKAPFACGSCPVNTLAK